MKSTSVAGYSASDMDRVVQLHRDNKGSVYNPKQGGDQSQKNGFVVILFKSREQMFPGPTVSLEDVRNYLSKNADLLGEAVYALDSWVDTRENRSYLNIAVVFSPASEEQSRRAMACARRAQQPVVLDLKDQQEVPIETQALETPVPGIEFCLP